MSEQLGSRARIMIGHDKAVRSVAALPDGVRVLSGSEDNTIRLWNLHTGAELRRFDHPDFVEAVAVLRDGRWAISGSGDHTMRLWDLATGAELRRFPGHSGTVSSLAALPDGSRALSGSHDHTERLWDLETGVELRRFERHQLGVNAVAALPDGRRALSGSADRTMRLWDLETGAELRRFDVGDMVYSVAPFPDWRRALSGSEDKIVRLWDLDTGAELRRFQGHTGAIWSVAVLRDGERALSGAFDGTLRLWDIGEPGDKRLVRYFVSFSQKDKRLKDDLLERLEERFAAAANYRFVGWQDQHIGLGSNWHQEIQAAIKDCDFGLLLVSPAFLGSQYIKTYDLPHFVAEGPLRPDARKPVAPVALKPILFDGSMDLKGLQERQVFRDKDRRAFQQLTGKSKDFFADQLFVKIIEMLDGHRRPFAAG